MKYIIIDNFNSNISILQKEDGSGEPIIFTSANIAQQYCDVEAQNGIVVPLTNLLKLFSNPDDIKGINEVLGDYIKT
jgi:hypothetical protein